MSSILQEIESQISGLKTTTSKSNVGVVREIGDGVARIEGLSDVRLNELVEFPGGVFGLALNLEESEVGAILLGDEKNITEGTEVKTTGRLLSVPVGKELLGRVSACSAIRSTARGRSIRPCSIRWRKSRPASSSGNP